MCPFADQVLVGGPNVGERVIGSHESVPADKQGEYKKNDYFMWIFLQFSLVQPGLCLFSKIRMSKVKTVLQVTFIIQACLPDVEVADKSADTMSRLR